MHRPLLLLIAATVFAQNPSGEISGRITDPDGHAVAGAPIQLKRAGGGEHYDAFSSPNGAYSFAGLPAGTYDLVIPTIGFTYRRTERKNINLAASQSVRLDIRAEWSSNLGTIGDDDATILRSNRPPAPSGPAPRMPDGHPDLSGVWRGANDPNPELAVVQPWAEAIFKERIANGGREHPSNFRLPGDVLLVFPNPFKIIHTPKLVMILAENNVGAFRQVFLDGRGHPKDPNPTWMGHSIGAWDGNTLVVDTVGFNDRSWVGSFPHTEALHVVTRYYRRDLGHLEIEIKVEDPAAFVKPWSTRVVWELAPDDEIQEYICENVKIRNI